MKLNLYDDYLGDEIRKLNHDRRHPEEHPDTNMLVPLILCGILVILYLIVRL